jgi:predicted dithiol-disulfide oxidoreductase (DUF899 family)
MNTNSTTSHHPKTVSREEWLAARLELLRREKEWTRRGDALTAEARELPWVRVETPYVFETREGTRTLGDLFAGRSQLAIYHFMFAPDWDEGCRSCSMIADQLDRAAPHLAERDVTLVLASRAPLATFEPFRARMGWTLPWVSTHGSTFNVDFGVTFPDFDESHPKREYNFGTAVPFAAETGGLSVFARRARDDAVYHTYSTYGRGGEPMMVPYFLLDRVPRGRHEEGLPWPTAWLRHRDRYGLE